MMSSGRLQNRCGHPNVSTTVSSRYPRYKNAPDLPAAYVNPLVVDDHPRRFPGRGRYGQKVPVSADVTKTIARTDHLEPAYKEVIPNLWRNEWLGRPLPYIWLRP